MNSLTVRIPEAIDKRIKLQTMLTPGEISWIGEVAVEKNRILIVDLFLLEQKTTPITTDPDDEAYAKFVLKYFESGKDPANLKLWLHSHGKYAVSWSPKDEETIETHSRAEYFLSIVINKQGDIKARVDFFNPLRVTFHNVNVIVVPEYPMEMIDLARNEVNNLVHYHEPEPVVTEKSNYFLSLRKRSANGVNKARRHTTPK